MSGIKRIGWHGVHGMQDDPNGDYILQSDHEAVVDSMTAALVKLDGACLASEQEVARLRTEVEHLTEALRCRTIDWNEAYNSRESWTEKAKAARAEADALRVDAMRYRWLRDRAPDEWSVLLWIDSDSQLLVDDSLMDERIDAAMGASA